MDSHAFPLEEAAAEQPLISPLVASLVQLVRVGVFEALSCELGEGWVYRIRRLPDGEVVEAMTRSRLAP